MTNEKYYCANCTAFDFLNQHGRCSRCNSSSVVSENAVGQVARGLAHSATLPTPRASLPKLTLYKVTYGPFYTTLYASNAEAAKRDADTSVYRTWQVDEGQHVDGYFDFTEMTVEPVKQSEFVSSSQSQKEAVEQ